MEEANNAAARKFRIPRRGRNACAQLIDGKEIGLPDGWYYEQRPRINAKYIGIYDQFYYEPGTNKQFRSMKEVDRYLMSKAEKIEPVATEALPVVDLTNYTEPLPKKRRSVTLQRRREIKWDRFDTHSNKPRDIDLNE